MYRLLWSKRALKELKSLNNKQAELLFSWAVRNLDGCDNPRTVGDGKAIKGTERGWRYRVGSYRLLVEIRDSELVVRVVRAGHRQGIYGNLPKL